MTEPASSTSTVAIATLAMASLFPGIPVNVVLGAFAGAVLFVVTSNDFGFGKKIFLFLASFIVGFLGADVVTQLLETIEGVQDIDPGVGALIASAIAVRVMLSLFKWLEEPQLPFSSRRRPPADDDRGGPGS